MTIYYVKTPLGSDNADGLSPETAFLTIAKALGLAVAGDRILLAAGAYNEQITINGRTLAQPISIEGDVAGRYFGYGGQVYIGKTTANRGLGEVINAGTSSTTAQAALDLISSSNWLFEGLVLWGGYFDPEHFQTYALRVRACSDLVFRRCLFYIVQTGNDPWIDLRTAGTPAGETLFDACTFIGLVNITYGTAAAPGYNPPPAGTDIDFKVRFVNCIHHVNDNAAIVLAGGGVQMIHGTLLVRKTPLRILNAATPYSHPNTIANCVALLPLRDGSLNGWNRWADESKVTLVNNLVAGWSGLAGQPADMEAPLFGALHDFTYYKELGQSPFRPYEPIVEGSYQNAAATMAASAYVPDEDFYGNPRGLAGQGEVFGCLDSHVAPAADPGGCWSNDALAADRARNDGASTATVGSSSANYLELNGAATYGDTGSIVAVYVRCVAGATGDTVYGVQVRLAGGQQVAAWQQSLTGVSAPADLRLSNWQLVAPPAAGWTWADVAGLVARVWKVSGATLTLNAVELAVVTRGSSSVGAVQAVNQPRLDTSVSYAALDTIRFDGPGLYETIMPVPAAPLIASVQVRTSPDYAGPAPVLEVLNTPGYPDQALAMSGAPDSWNEITIALTPSAAGFVRVRLLSYDTSRQGVCHFANLKVVG